jgi:hypothetical protein
MKKASLFIVLLLGLNSCNIFNSTEGDQPKPTQKDLVLGGDKDENGCLTSAGYTWSKLNKECVRAFSGIQLLPIEQKEEDATLCAYILFDESGNQSEVFLPNMDSSIVLERSSKTSPWKFEDWELVASKGYQLKKSGKLRYQGDGEIGGVISDDNEQIPAE